MKGQLWFNLHLRHHQSSVLLKLAASLESDSFLLVCNSGDFGAIPGD